MRLVLHIGLHKTASTAFQTLCRDNAGRLLQFGIHWRVHDAYPAHHETAWALLRGEVDALGDYLSEASAAGARTALLSSEELDYVLLVPQTAKALEAAARQAGVQDVTWIAALRRPSEVFRSVISELTKHGIHVDPLQGYLEIRRSGGLHFTGRLNGGHQFWNWFKTFDYARYLGRLREEVAGRVIAYDYHAEERVPGAPILRAATPDADRLIDEMQSPGIVNRRLSEEEIAANLESILRGHGHDMAEISALMAVRQAGELASAETGADRIIDAALDARFGDYDALLGDGTPDGEGG
jgi:hypothetical protein